MWATVPIARAARLPGAASALERRELSPEQAEAMRALVPSGDGVQVLDAPAGTGKTYALAKQAWERSELQVGGRALSARAAHELEDEAGIDATTVARLGCELEHGHPLMTRTVLIVDEAGMVRSRCSPSWPSTPSTRARSSYEGYERPDEQPFLFEG